LILVDSSVWIEFFRGRNKNVGYELQHLLDSDEVILAAPIRIEILSGCSKKTLSRLRKLLSALPLYYPSESTWKRIEGWIETAVTAGQKFGMGDLLIASIAVDQDSLLWSLDSDFERMETLDWLEMYRPK
jgi:predicted nucleic acid-binding protein